MNPSKPNSKSADPLEAFIAELVSIGGTLSQVVDHMARFQASGRSAPDIPPIEVILGNVLKGVLEPLVDRHGKPALRGAAAALSHANDLICSEVYLVPHDLPPDDDEVWSEAG